MYMSDSTQLIISVRMYVHIMNCKVLSRELYHTNWKAWADVVAPPNLMGHLFTKHNLLQSLRLGFAGA